MNPTEPVVRGILAHHVRCDPRSLRTCDRLRGDLGLTMLGLALVVIDIEDARNIRLTAEGLASVQTVGDLVSIVEEAGMSPPDRAPREAPSKSDDAGTPDA